MPAVGQKARRSLTLTAEHVRAFAQLTGDYNPLHFEAAFVARTRFQRPIVQGGLTTGLLHALVATDLPGPGTVFLSQNWRFTAPVFIGDTITAEAEVVSVHPAKPVTQLKVRVARESDETVLEGEAWCYTAPVLTSTITCPVCGHGSTHRMPEDSCRFFLDCPACHQVLRPKSGECCVFCSYGDVRCPPRQTSGG